MSQFMAWAPVLLVAVAYHTPLLVVSQVLLHVKQMNLKVESYWKKQMNLFRIKLT